MQPTFGPLEIAIGVLGLRDKSEVRTKVTGKDLLALCRNLEKWPIGVGLERFGPERLLLRLAALVPQATNLLEPSEEKWWWK